MQKIVASIGFLAIALSLVIGRLHPARGYEIDIYSSTPLLFWVFLTLAMACGTSLVVNQAFRNDDSGYWRHGLGILVLGTLTIALLPVIRGYAMFHVGDSSGHIGMVRDILQTGHPSDNNPYPVVHTLIWEIATIGGVGPTTAGLWLPAIQSGLFVIATYLLATVTFSRPRHVLLAAASSIVLFYSYYHATLYPSGQGLLFQPVVFFLFFKGWSTENDAIQYKALLLLTLLMFVFFHPVVAVLLVIYLLAVEGAKLFWNRRILPRAVGFGEVPSLDLFGFLAVPLFLWISGMVWFGGTVTNIYGFITGDFFASGHLETVPSVIGGQGISIAQLILTFTKNFLDNIIYVGLTVVAGLFLLRSYTRRETVPKYLFILFILFLVSIPVWLVLFMGSRSMTLGRFLSANAAMWVTPLFVGFALCGLFSGQRWKALGPVVVSCILLATWAISAFWMFPSLSLMRVNLQVAEHEMKGVGWFADHNDARYEIISMGVLPPQLASVVGFNQTVSEREDVQRWFEYRAIGIGGLQPENFMYKRYSSLGDWQTGRAYLVLTERFRKGSLDPTLKKGTMEGFATSAPWLTEENFQRFENDPNVDRLYSNGEFDVFVIAKSFH